MALVLVTPAATEPITLSEAKDQLRLEISDDDTLVTSLIVSAREYAEHTTRRQFVTATWKLVLDKFPDEISVPLPPLQSITSIQYTDTDGTQQTLASSEYTVDTASEPARICPSFGNDWPSTRDEKNALEVTFVAGYGTASAVPQTIKDSLLVYLSWLYEDRQGESSIPMAVSALLRQHEWGIAV